MPEPTLPPITPVPTTAKPTLPPTTTLPPDCTGLADATSGGGVYVGADGQQRTFELAVSRYYDGTRAAPLILNFHEHSSSGSLHDKYTLMGNLATQRGYIVVSPDSTSSPPSWNTRAATNRLDDFAFAHGLVSQLLTTMCVDPTRIYAAGHSNGGMFAALLVCSAPYEFAAVAVVGAVPLSSCPAEVQPAVIEILGTADAITLYEGRITLEGRIVKPSAVESINSWALHAGCVDPPATVLVEDGVEAMRFDGCSGADVVLLTVIGGAHPWPGGSVARISAENSEAGRTFPATETILNFFADAG